MFEEKANNIKEMKQDLNQKQIENPNIVKDYLKGR